MKKFFTMISVAMLASCASFNQMEEPTDATTIQPKPKAATPKKEVVKIAPMKGWETWGCDKKVAFNWRFVDKKESHLDIRMNGSDMIERLTQVSVDAKTGKMFTDGYWSFQKLPKSGTLYKGNDLEVVASNCKAL
jgi:hypothetical protein